MRKAVKDKAREDEERAKALALVSLESANLLNKKKTREQKEIERIKALRYRTTASWYEARGYRFDSSTSSYITAGEFDRKYHGAEALVHTAKNAIHTWREFKAIKGTAAASRKVKPDCEPVARLMPTFDSERHPEVPLKSPWTVNEESLWDYLELVACAQQRHFQYSHTDISRLPHSFSTLKLVEEVNLSHNKLINLPSELFALPLLRRLFLENNQIRVLPDMSRCQALETLDVRNNLLAAVPLGLSACPNLQTFDAEKNKLKDFGDLVNCPKLDFLNLSLNLIKTIPAELPAITTLRYFLIKNNPIVNLPPHIYMQGMAAIMSYINEATHLSSETEISSIRSDFFSLLTTSASTTNITILATKESPPIALDIPYTLPEDLQKVDSLKVKTLLLMHSTSQPVVPSKVDAHSLILLARIPSLRNRIIETLNSEKKILELCITPYQLQVLVKYVYADAFTVPTPPTQEMASTLAKTASEHLTNRELEALRHSLVRHWRTSLTDAADTGTHFELGYLVTLAFKALGMVENKDRPYASSSYVQDFKALLPTSTRADASIVHEWDNEDAMKHIKEGFSELSLLGGPHAPNASNALRASSSEPRKASSATLETAIDHTTGVSSLNFAPNDMAFRVMDDPNAPLIGAHKAILCARSAYLRNMLTGGLVESRQTVVEIWDISYDTLKSIVEFCYTDDVTEIHGEMIMELLMKARLFGLDRLLGYVESIVGYSLDISNIVSILGVAYLYELPRLAKATKFFVLTNWSEVTLEPSWNDLDALLRLKLVNTAVKWGIVEDEPSDSKSVPRNAEAKV